MVTLNIMNFDETLDYINREHCSVSRYGDGEFGIMLGGTIGFQGNEALLVDQLKAIVKCGDNGATKCLICIPGYWANEKLYTEGVSSFWMKVLPFEGRRRKYYRLCSKTYQYGNADITRCYLGIFDKKSVKRYFGKWKEIWDKRDVFVIEGEFTRLGIGTDLFNNVKSLKRILCPAENAFKRINRIEEYIKSNIEKNALILIALGPTATVLCYKLSQQGYWAIDIGNIDKEYEWYTMGAKEKMRNPVKYSIEVSNGTYVQGCFDKAYQDSIIYRIS